MSLLTTEFYTLFPTRQTTKMSADDKPIIIVKGKEMNSLNDYYCHETLGGCGCVFRAKSPIVVKDYEGDVIESYFRCPNEHCRRKINISLTYDKKITYGKVEYFLPTT